MSYFFGDGWDLYTQITDCGGYWDSTFGGGVSLALSASGRFSGSRGLTAISFSATPYITKTSSVNDAVHHIVVAAQQASALSGTQAGIYFTLFDGATAQCTVAFRSDGAMILTSGGPAGTTLATYTGAVAAINTWYGFEVEVVINNTTGSFTVRKNGNTSNDFSLGSLNTRASANNYANKIGVGMNWNSAGGQTIDDFLWRSDASAVAWAGDVRCFTRMPLADSAVQFTRSGSVVPLTPFVGTASVNMILNTARYSPFVATCDGTVGTASVALAAGYTGNMKCTLFNNSGSNTPGTVLASATAISNPVIGNNTFTFSSPPILTRGTTYWIGFGSDTSLANTWNMPGISAGAYSNSAASSNTTYAAFPVASPTLTLTGQQANIFTVNITPTTLANADFVSEVVQDAAASYVYSSTNGQADLYTLGAISATPTTIIGVTTRGLFQKSDAGTRNATVQLKSGGTTVQGTSTALPAGSWQWIARNDLVDPATGVAWTATGVNNALCGPVVTA